MKKTLPIAAVLIMSSAVWSSEDQDVVRLSITTQPTRVYPTQSFVVRLSIAVKGLPDPVADRDPLSMLRVLPSLQIPWVDDEMLPAGLKPQTPWQRWLNDLADAEGAGFAINDLQGRRDLFSELLNRDPLDLLQEKPLARGGEYRLPFRPPVRKVLLPDSHGRRITYWEYSLDRRFTANRVAKYRFGPVSLKGHLVARMNTRGSLEAEEVDALAKSIEVDVVEPPLQDRPASYTGAIGRFTIKSELIPHEAQVGDPMTLTLLLQGTNALERAFAPNLAVQPGIQQDFKIYDPTEETVKQQRRFTYGIRPLHEQVEAFPAVEFSFFDADADKYVKLKTNPIPIRVRPAAQLGRNEIAVAGDRTPRQALELAMGGVFANITDLGQVRNEAIREDLWLLGLGGLAVLFLLLVATKQVVQRRQRDPARRRRRIAQKRLKLRLDSAHNLAETSDWHAMAEQCSAALIGLAADVADLPEMGCTSAEAIKQLEDVQVRSDLLQAFEQLLAECEAIRFGAATNAHAGVVERAESLSVELLAELREKRLVG